MVERWIHTPNVVGSNPIPCFPFTNIPLRLVVRTVFFQNTNPSSTLGGGIYFVFLSWGDSIMVSVSVCKTENRGSNPLLPVLYIYYDDRVAQRLEHRSEKAGVDGSNPFSHK